MLIKWSTFFIFIGFLRIPFDKKRVFSF
jgi:hypothetical protein